MIDVNQLRKGITYTEDGEIYKVLDFWHNKPGRGNATIRLSVRNMRSGGIKDITYNSGVRVQDIEVEKHEVQYLYDDGEFLTFMDTESFEQPQIRRELFGDDAMFLKENTTITLNTYEGEIIDYTLPNMVDLEVAEAEPGFAGDTANNPVKRIKTETGLEVAVPLYVTQGEIIRVKTEDGSYVQRVM
jgi:elongation factor P